MGVPGSLPGTPSPKGITQFLPATPENIGLLKAPGGFMFCLHMNIHYNMDLPSISQLKRFDNIIMI